MGVMTTRGEVDLAILFAGDSISQQFRHLGKVPVELKSVECYKDDFARRVYSQKLSSDLRIRTAGPLVITTSSVVNSACECNRHLAVGDEEPGAAGVGRRRQ